MTNWIEGNWPERFRCIGNHDGVFDQRMMYCWTDELWFSEWEFRGSYYQNPEGYERENPADLMHQVAYTDARRPRRAGLPHSYTQGIGAFTALQRRGVESRLLVFPDESHMVAKPANSVQWHDTVIGWLDTHLKN
jgi:dipeptidyl aminopeptidase/acylaminoacyl peptidase